MTTRKPKKLTTAQKVAAAKRPQATESLCVRGDLMSEYVKADEALRLALGAAPTSLAGHDEDEIRALAQRVEDLRSEMLDYTIEVLFVALPQTRWNELKAEHPPRVGDDGGVHDDDRAYGVDVTTFFPAALVACTAEPADLTADMWKELLDDKLSDGQISNACMSVWLLNRSTVNVPFSHAASKILSSSGS